MIFDISILPILLKGVGLYIVFVILRRIQDVYFGPLSHIPGPKLAAATRLVTVYHKIKGDAEHWRAELHEKYGDVVRPAPTDVSFATGKVWKDIYGHESGSVKDKMIKDPKFYSFTKPGRPTSLSAAPQDVHTRQRRVFNAAFAERVLTQQMPLLRSYTDQLLANLRKAAERKDEIDMAANYNFITFDIMADLTFGKPLGCLQNSESTDWMRAVFGGLTVLSFLIETHYYPWAKLLIGLMIPPSLKRQAEQNKQNSREILEQRQAMDVKRPDIWGLLEEVNDQKDEHQKLLPQEFMRNARLFMTAGTETSATLLAGLTFYLLKNPDKMTKLTEEIRSTFSSVEDMTLASLSQMDYLNACIQEGLRLYPPVPIGLPRLVPNGGIELSGYFIPQGTSVAVHQYSAFRSSRNFVHHESFVPERWLNEPPAEYVNDERSVFHPFSMGPRMCLGINLAWAEMRLILASVLFSYDLTLCDESQNWRDQKVFLMWKKGPMMVTLKPAGKQEP